LTCSLIGGRLSPFRSRHRWHNPNPGTLLAFLTEVPEPRDRAGRRHPLVATLAHACVHLLYGLVTDGVLSIADR
jgi:hypothetical protein